MTVDHPEGEKEEGSEGESTEEEEEWEQVKRPDARPTTSPSDSADALEDPPAHASDILDLTTPDWDFGFSAAQISDVVRALLESDTKGARAAQDAPAWQSSYSVRPFGTAVAKGDYTAVAALAVFGAKVGSSEEDVSRAADTRKQRAWIGNAKNWREWAHHPLEAALARGEGIESIKMLLSYW
ncbi:unnamed protein product [Peniophora sp. CBMAI 1063]|nr:unnamed protein product [Peniophora sp. CBMAI 1063]